MALILADGSRIKVQRKDWKATQIYIVVTGMVITDTGLRGGEESSCPGGCVPHDVLSGAVEGLAPNTTPAL